MSARRLELGVFKAEQNHAQKARRFEGHLSDSMKKTRISLLTGS